MQEIELMNTNETESNRNLFSNIRFYLINSEFSEVLIKILIKIIIF
jgi:hypothetical protein